MILLIDSYDSFTNNLSRLIEDSTGKQVITIHNDTFKASEYDLFRERYLPFFEYVVIGPGPGSPSKTADVGIILWLFEQFKSKRLEECVPILGICLGFQSLCHCFGNKVLRLDDVKHGQVYKVFPIEQKHGNDLFPNETFQLQKKKYSVPCVRYHSLYIDIDELNDSIIPLAFSEEYDLNGHSSPRRILMAGKHAVLPFYGVQYHPESICSEGGDDVIKAFSDVASSFNSTYRPCLASLKQESCDLVVSKLIESHPLTSAPLFDTIPTVGTQNLKLYVKEIEFKLKSTDSVCPIDICEHFHEQKKNDFFLLNSAAIPGEWSIIAIPTDSNSHVLTHSVDMPDVIIRQKYKSNMQEEIQLGGCDTVWGFVGKEMEKRYFPRETIMSNLPEYSNIKFPFLGGYVGLFSYEEGQHISLEKLESPCNGPTPDLKLVFTEKFIAHDKTTNKWYIGFVSDLYDYTNWCVDVAASLVDAENKNELIIEKNKIPSKVKDFLRESDKQSVGFELPCQETYLSQFEKCQEYLHSGDSYELCLTTQLKIVLPSYISAWDIYKVLTIHNNPSPFSCFMDFGDLTLISSSPERFLSWKNHDDGSRKVVELRPIKGTVKKTPDNTLEKAVDLLKTPKEMGENLMIVDLIRHDLHQYIHNVTVPQLMEVEEYKTVYQLVSVIQGLLDQGTYHGLDILCNSLPPGSMTGAPKKRSVHLLQQIESLQKTSPTGRRGVYSGVAGYWSITDEADWSVIIRSIYHYTHDKQNSASLNTWKIGAGGAITVLSDPYSEWDEMILKLRSALLAFK